MTRGGALLLAALVLWFDPLRAARADGLAPVDAGAIDVPCAADAGFPLLELPPDGGPPWPVPMNRCQVAPVNGVFLTTARAAQLAGERERLRFEATKAKHELELSDARVVALQGLVAGALTAAAYAYCRGHDCNPLHH